MYIFTFAHYPHQPTYIPKAHQLNPLKENPNTSLSMPQLISLKFTEATF